MQARIGTTDARAQMELYNSLFNFIICQESNPNTENCSSHTLTLQHLAILAKLIGVSLDGPSLHRLAWGLSCREPLSITREEFLRGAELLRGSDAGGPAEPNFPQERSARKGDPKFDSCLVALRNFIERKDKELRASHVHFRSFYRFLFDWVRSPETTARGKTEMGMSIETAVELWRMLFPEYKSFSRMDDWCTFCTTQSLFRREAVSRDLWEQLLEFTSLSNYDTYDVNDAWPSAIDDFVEWYKKKDKI